MSRNWAENVFRRLYPQYHHRWEVYNEVLCRQITGETVWLDIGCGANEHIAEYGKMAKTAIGIDVIDYNNRIDAPFLKADLRKIPLPDSYATLITLRMVVEHLDRIPEDFAEIDRLLAHGGTLLILTTNSWSPLISLPRLLPYALKKWIIRKLFGIADNELFPTYHRFNTPAKMKRGVLNLSLTTLEFLEQVPFSSPFLTLVFGAWYSVVHFTLFRYLRSNLLATFQKRPGY